MGEVFSDAAANTVSVVAAGSDEAATLPLELPDAEATIGRRSLLLSRAEDGTPLDQPGLVTDGDVYGGRYVSGVLALKISTGCRR